MENELPNSVQKNKRNMYRRALTATRGRIRCGRTHLLTSETLCFLSNMRKTHGNDVDDGE